MFSEAARGLLVIPLGPGSETLWTRGATGPGSIWTACGRGQGGICLPPQSPALVCVGPLGLTPGPWAFSHQAGGGVPAEWLQGPVRRRWPQEWTFRGLGLERTLALSVGGDFAAIMEIWPKNNSVWEVCF